MPLANCPSREELAAFSAGNLEDTALTALGTHIDSCPACQRLIQTVSLEASDTIVSALRGSVAANPHAAESACRSAIERIAALPENSAISIPVGTPIAHEAPLQQLREYKLLAKLGEGGMGAVYKALHTRLDKTVAIKVLPADRMRDPGAVARFQREMKAVGRVDHPNIVRAMDAGEENGMHYLVMEYVPGSDLSQLAKAIGPLPVADACELVRQAALGLAEANEHGMVHRDIKPSNLILTQPRKKKDQPIVKILDLGLALLSEAFSPDQRGLTSTGQMMGTIDYMAPEQGGDSHQVDIRADIYSLGATLYKLLAGEAPFAGEKYDTPIKKLVALGTVEPDPIRQRRPDVPAPLAAIIHKMLAKDPAARFATPDEVVEALLPFCQGCDLGALLDGRVQGSRFGVQKEEVGGQRSEVGTEKSALAVTAPVISSVSPSLPLPVSPSSSRTRKPPLVALIAAGAGALALLIAGIVLLIPDKDGTLRIEINDPKIEVAVKGTKIVLKKADNGKDIELAPGEKTLVVTRGDFSFETDKLVLKKGKTTTVSVDLLPGKVQVAQDGVPLSAVELKPLATPVAALPLYVSPSKYALAFDGKSNYVTLPRVKLDGAQALTIEADIQPTKLQMVDLLGDGAIGFTWCAANCPPHFKFGMITPDKDFPHANATVGILPREPLHLAGVLDIDELRVYLNGKLIERQLTPKKRIEPALTAFMIGANEWLALNKPGSSSETESYLNFFEGRIQRLRVSTVARYQENFTPGARFVPDNDTLALYHFDEGQGTELKDSSGNNHHGKIVGAKWVRLPSPDSVNDDAIDLAAERTAAEWVLSVGGTITLKKPDGAELPLASGKLPAEPSVLSKITITGNKSLRDEDLAHLSRCRRIEWVNLSYNNLNGSGLAHLRRSASPLQVIFANQGESGAPESLAVTDSTFVVFADLPQLRWLNLSGNAAITDTSMDVLGRLTNLEVLDLSGTKITDDGLQRLDTLTGLVHLEVNGMPQVTDRGVAHVIARHPGLKQLCLFNGVNQRRTLTPLAAHPTLEAVWPSGDQLTAEGAKVLAGLPKLQWLPIANPTDDGLARLNLPQLKALTLFFFTAELPEFTPAAYLSVSKLTGLENLQAEGAFGSPDDAGLAALAKLPKLKELSLSFGEQYHPRNYTAAGITKFRELRPDVALTVDGKEYPALDGNAIDFAAERAAAEWVLSVGGTVGLKKPAGAELPLIDGKLPAEAFVLSSLTIVGNQTLRDEDLAHLSRCRRIEVANLSFNNLNGSGLAHLKSCSDSLHLIFAGQGEIITSQGAGRAVTDATIEALGDLTQVRKLNLAGNGVLTDASADVLSRLTNLELLNLSNINFTDDALEKLDALTGLVHLEVNQMPQVTDRGIEHVIAGHPGLKSLYVSNGVNQRRTLTPLAALPKLEEVGLSSDQLTPEGAKVLAGLSKLQYLMIGNPTDEGLARLNLPQLKGLTMYFFVAGLPEFTPAAYASVAKLSGIEYLHIEGATGSPDDAGLLALAKLPKLKTMTLAFSEQYNPRKYTADGIAKFRELRPEVVLAVDGKVYPSTAASKAETKTLPPAVAPFDAAQARAHQEAWAKHLDVNVETSNSIGMKLRLIPPGEFLMGSIKGDANEQPVHKVTITKPYYLGTYEVTQEEYEAVVGSNPSKFPGKRLPVEFVTSEEAAEFCKKLSEKEGKTYRLPTEAEWEFACRAGTPTEWSFGDDVALLSEYAWTKENGQEKTHPVGEKKPNPFGLFDMHGNVFEYCSDYTAAYSADSATDPTGPELGRYRGFRGGSWFFQKFDSRSADRQDKEWPARGTHVGFRVVLEIKP